MSHHLFERSGTVTVTLPGGGLKQPLALVARRVDPRTDPPATQKQFYAPFFSGARV
jgi:hypothetical protein